MRGNLSVVLVVLVAASLGSPAGPARAEDRDFVRIDIREPLSIENFLKVIGAYGDVPLVWDGGDRHLQAELLSATELRATKEGFFDVTRALLFSRGLVLVPLGPAGQEVYCVAHVLDAVPFLRPEVITVTDANVESLSHQEGVYVATMLKAPHLDDLALAEKMLDEHCTMKGVGSVTRVPEARALLVVDFAPAVATMYRTLESMDAAAAAKRSTLKMVHLEHANARETAAVLEHAFGANQPLPNPTTLLDKGIPEPPPLLRITPDARTNQILVTGPAERVDEVLQAIPELDVPTLSPETLVWTHVVRLKHVSAIPAADAVQRLLPRPGDETPSSFQASARVVPHGESHSVLVTATPHDFEQIKALLDDLDREE